MPASSVEQRIAEVYDQTMRRLYRFVSRRCGADRALVEDIVQEVWLRAVAAWRKQGVPHAPEAWLIAVARNLVVTYYRRQRLLPLDANVSVELVLTAVERGGTESLDVERLIHWSLARLPERQARLLEAFHLERRPVAELAREFRLSDRAIEGRLRRARIDLRRVIEKATGRRGAHHDIHP
jgi:RNA polymerase sigma-70 factor (ECF subfamily)